MAASAVERQDVRERAERQDGREARAGGVPAGPSGEAGTGLWPLLACTAAWCGWFIFRSSFVASGQRVFCLLDDAMVAMTYARNAGSLAAGHGLAWAGAGEPVEGFTQPLWVALMVPVNALPLALRLRGLPVQLLSLAALLWNLVLVRRLTRRHFSTARARHWLPAAVLTAFYYPLNYCALMGLESGLQALLTTALVLLALDVVWGGEDRHRELWLVGAAACLLRMDMLLIVAVVQIYILAKGGVRGPRRRASWLQGAALCGAALAAYGAWRWVSFHDLLPNAWYLRFYRIPPAVRLMRGAVTLGAWISDHLLLLAAVAAGYVAAVFLRPRGAEPSLPDAPGLPAQEPSGAPAAAARSALPTGLAARMELPAGLILVACLVSVFAGGDAIEADLLPRANRFLVFVMPLLFILWNGLINQAADRIARRRPGDALLRRFVVTLATVLALVVADGLWLAADDAGNWMALLGGDPPAGVRSHAEIYASLRSLQGRLQAGRVVATGAPGITAYFTGFRVVDMLGGNERRIARSAPAVPLRPGDFADYVPGRAKWDHGYVLAGYRPDAVLGWRGAGDPAPWLAAAGYRRVAGGEIWLRGAPAP
jgi:hypothetical protein